MSYPNPAQSFRPVLPVSSTPYGSESQPSNQSVNQTQDQYGEYNQTKDDSSYQSSNQSVSHSSPDSASQSTASHPGHPPSSQPINQSGPVYQSYQPGSYRPVHQPGMHDGSMGHAVVEQQHYEIVEDDSHMHPMHRRGTIGQPISQPINQPMSQPMSQAMAYQPMQFQAHQAIRPQQAFRAAPQAMNQPRYQLQPGMPMVVHHPHGTMSMSSSMNPSINQAIHPSMQDMSHIDTSYTPIQPVIASASPPASVQMMEPPGRKKKVRTARRCQDREKHSKAEQKRRGEMKILFDQLQEISQCVYKDRIHILTLAIQTIQKQKEAIASLQSQVRRRTKRKDGDAIKTEPGQDEATSNPETTQQADSQAEQSQIAATMVNIRHASLPNQMDSNQSNNQSNNQSQTATGYTDYHFVDGNNNYPTFQQNHDPSLVRPIVPDNNGYVINGVVAHSQPGWPM